MPEAKKITKPYGSVKFTSVDEYIKSFSKPVQQLLEEIRSAIRQAAPKAEEVISYNMPAYKQDGMLVYFAAQQQHIGFYPTASPIVSFAKELLPYKTSKGAVQFPFEKKMPFALIKKIVKFKIQENQAKLQAKQKSK